MDLVYILGTGSLYDNKEIKFSLRSVEKYGENVGDVYVVGERPSSISNIIHIPCKDIYDKKANNAWYKLKHFCSLHRKSFVLMNDDFFLLQKTNFDKLPLYYDRDIKYLVDSYKESTIFSILQEYTRDLLLRLNSTENNYAIHTPITIEPEKLLVWMNLFRDTPNISLRNFYGNICEQGRGEQLDDIKFNKKLTEFEFSTLTKDKKFFSIGDEFLPTGFNILNKLYSTPSTFERK